MELDNTSDLSLSDYPDDLSESSLSKQDTNRVTAAPTQTDFSDAGIRQDTLQSEQVLPTLPAHLAHPTPPTPPDSQGQLNAVQPAQPPSPSTPPPLPSTPQFIHGSTPSTPSSELPTPSTPQVAHGPADVPSPQATNGTSSSHNAPIPWKAGRGRATPRTPHRTKVSTSTPSTPRRGTRIRRPPTKFSGLELRSPSPDPAPEPTSQTGPESGTKSLRVTLRLDSEALLRFGTEDHTMDDSRPETPHTPSKRKQSVGTTKPSPKRARKSSGQAKDASVVPPGPEAAVPQLAPSMPDSVDWDKLYVCGVPQNSELWPLGQKLMVQTFKVEGPDPIDNAQKPEPNGKPVVWAKDRSSLCATLPDFNQAYQSSNTSHDGIARGFLFSNSPCKRDFMDGSVLITRASGGMKKSDPKMKNRSLDEDQKSGVKTEHLRAAMKAYNPVVLLTKDNNPLVPSRMPHQYCVLDHFKTTQIWHEKIKQPSGQRLEQIRYLFERLNPKRELAWWQAKGTEELAPPGSLNPPVVRSCSFCHKLSQQKYLQGWMCTQEGCQANSMLLTPLGELHEPDDDTLVYDPRFVKQKTTWPSEHLRYSVLPKAVELSENTHPQELYSAEAWKGKVCPKCNGCILRMGFSGWACDSEGCDWEHQIRNRRVMPASAIADPNFPLTDSYMPGRDRPQPGVLVSKPTYAHNYRIDHYTFPGAGNAAHMLANKTVVEEPEGPNDMFEELQRKDIGFKRRKIGSENHKDPKYTAHMNVNFGETYKFVATGIDKSQSFDDANADAVRNVRSRLNWAMKAYLALKYGKTIDEVAYEWSQEEFNEMLALAYWEKSGIGFHDDGEPGVGPRIATISLGHNGEMVFKMKATRYWGRSQSGVYDYEHPPIPGCYKYEERAARHEEILANAPAKNRTQYYKKVSKELGLTKHNKSGPTMIKMTLGHGDIVIMDGALIQKYYNHSVHHDGKIRFALTCRYIDSESVKAEDRPDFVVGPDPGNYDGTKLKLPTDYKGDPIPNARKFPDPEPVEGDAMQEVDVQEDEAQEDEAQEGEVDEVEDE